MNSLKGIENEIEDIDRQRILLDSKRQQLIEEQTREQERRRRSQLEKRAAECRKNLTSGFNRYQSANKELDEVIEAAEQAFKAVEAAQRSYEASFEHEKVELHKLGATASEVAEFLAGLKPEEVVTGTGVVVVPMVTTKWQYSRIFEEDLAQRSWKEFNRFANVLVKVSIPK